MQFVDLAFEVLDMFCRVGPPISIPVLATLFELTLVPVGHFGEFVCALGAVPLGVEPAGDLHQFETLTGARCRLDDLASVATVSIFEQQFVGVNDVFGEISRVLMVGFLKGLAGHAEHIGFIFKPRAVFVLPVAFLMLFGVVFSATITPSREGGCGFGERVSGVVVTPLRLVPGGESEQFGDLGSVG